MRKLFRDRTHRDGHGRRSEGQSSPDTGPVGSSRNTIGPNAGFAGDEDLKERVLDITDGHGADLAFDGVGGPWLDGIAESMT